MAATSVLKLVVDDKEYSASLKNAKQGMQALQESLQAAGKSFLDVDKSVVEYAKALGNMATASKTAKGKIGEMSSAFVELSVQYKHLTDQEKQSPVGKAMSESLATLKTRVIDAKQELSEFENQLKEIGNTTPSSGLFGGLSDKMGGAIQVFAGNMLTKAAGAVAGLTSEMYGMVQQGIELAKQGEGIRIAFERLGRGDILDGLRQATHGTVIDLELMKAAVKFNDFKLPVEELGTMLAFAQQKAKDTGQSVDYMVDSIVTGLGRKSLMILDNLGLSANDIKEKMKETGDMTKAVGEIIREQMSKAGDYVETAADRATQANVSLQNKMEELGRKFAPVEEASNQLWSSMKIGILDIIGGPLATMLNQLTEAGRLKNMLNSMNGEAGSGNTKVDNQLKKLNVIKKGGGSDYIFNSTLNGMMEDYNRQIMALDTQIKNGGKPVGGGSGSSQDVRYLQQKMDALKIMRDQLAAGAKELSKPITIETNRGGGVVSGVGSGGSVKNTIKEDKDDFEEIIGLIPNAEERVKSLKEQIRTSWDEGEISSLTEDLKAAEAELQRLQNIGKETNISFTQGLSGFNAQTMGAWMQSRQGDLSKAEYGSADYSSIMGNIADMNTIKTILEQSMKAGVDAAQIDLEPLWEKVFDGQNIPDSTWQSLVDIINEKLEEMGIDPIKVNFETGSLEQANKGAKESQKEFRAAASAISQAGAAMQSIEDPSVKIMGMIGQSIASIALGFATASAQEGKGGIWYWIAATMAGLATMISTISAIHSATGYANGGMIQGNSYSGDNLTAMGPDGGLIGLNAGEVVLNKAQQNSLADQLSGNGLNNINVAGRIRGTDIILSVDRSLQLQGKQLLTWG